MVTEPFAKLLSSITRSSIWEEDSDTRIVWVTLLAMADREGFIGAAVTGIAHEARVPLAATEDALERFLSPDKYSRNPSHDGRRIERVEGGWRLLNYAKIRNNLDAEAVKEYEAKKKREYRARKKNVHGQSEDPSASASNSASASASASGAREVVEREDVARVWTEVTGRTDLPEIGVNWAGKQEQGGDIMRRWANANGGLDALRKQLAGLLREADDFAMKQGVLYWAERVGTIRSEPRPTAVDTSTRRRAVQKWRGDYDVYSPTHDPESEGRSLAAEMVRLRKLGAYVADDRNKLTKFTETTE